MKFKAEIQIIPHEEIVEPQGQFIVKNLPKLDINDVESIRIGKFVLIHLEADTEIEAHQKVEKTCRELLVNPLIETYEFQLKILEEETFDEEEVIEEETATEVQEEKPEEAQIFTEISIESDPESIEKEGAEKSEEE